MNTTKDRGGTSNKQLDTVDIVLQGNSYYDKSLTKIGGVVNYGVCARDRPEGV